MQAWKRPFGVVLAGGLARRMGGGDKALLMLGRRTLLEHLVARIAPQVDGLVLNANGDRSRFAASGLAVVGDAIPGFPGPLAGVLAGMRWAQAQGGASLLSVPVDTPFLPPDLVARLEAARIAIAAPIAFAAAGGRRHPVVALWPVALADALERALADGTRAVAVFGAAHGAVAAEFPDPSAFFNINQPEDLEHAQRMTASDIAHRRTVRLVLRPPHESDLGFVTDIFARHELVSHRPDPRPDSPEASAARLARDIAHWHEHGFGRWAAERDGRVIGFGGVTMRAGQDGLNISYHLHPDAWGRGYASELVAETLAVAFGLLGARRVVGLVRPANPASRRVLERAGFMVEAEVELGGAPTLLLARYGHSDLHSR